MRSAMNYQAIEGIVEFRRWWGIAVAEAHVIRATTWKVPASWGIKSRNMCEELGKPCYSTIDGEVLDPASR